MLYIKKQKSNSGINSDQLFFGLYFLHIEYKMIFIEC
jgi:hypothetical protein